MSIYIILIIVLFLLLILLFCTMLSFQHIFKLSHPIKHNYKIDITTAICYKKFSFVTKDKIKLVGIEYLPKVRPVGTILACHYLGGSKESILPFLESLLQAGYKIISFDFRNHGESGTQNRVKYSLERDFAAFVKSLRGLEILEPVGVAGFSMGATTAIHGLGKIPYIKAAFVDSGPLLNVKDYFNYVANNKKIVNPLVKFLFIYIYMYCIGFKKMSVETKKVLRKIGNKPILFIHGDRDSNITIDNPQLAIKLISSDTSNLLIFKKSRHLTNFFNQPEEYADKVTSFFNQNLRKE